MHSETTFRFTAKALAPIGLICTLLSASAWAKPLHLAIGSARSATLASCTFPDGTSVTSLPDVQCYNPTQFMDAYGISALHAKGVTGKGQTIILVDSYGSPTVQADLDQFSDAFNLPHTQVQFIYPNGPFVNPVSTSDQQGWAYETTLDVEWAHALAPDATIVNVVTSSSETEGLDGFPDIFKGIQMAIAAYPNSVISMSLGTGEADFTPSDISTYVKGSFEQILRQAVQADITVLAASGDSGSVNLTYDESTYQTFQSAGYPASDPLVTAVGGTWLQSGWRWNPQGTADDYWNCQITGTCPDDFLAFTSTPGQITEAVWKEDWLPAASSGGVSTIFQEPFYQALVNPQAQAIMKGYRGVPDIAMNAAVDGGVMIFTSYDPSGTPSPQWSVVGGTSAASPETAALVALAGQSASDVLQRNVGVGFLNPVLYSLPASDFNDIVPQTFAGVTLSDNSLYFGTAALAAYGPSVVPPVAVPGEPITQGYDLGTGRGSPRAVQFVGDIAAAVVFREIVGLAKP